jgi:hypothetical protein
MMRTTRKRRKKRAKHARACARATKRRAARAVLLSPERQLAAALKAARAAAERAHVAEQRLAGLEGAIKVCIWHLDRTLGMIESHKAGGTSDGSENDDLSRRERALRRAFPG